jgi:hypothetical protein
MSGGWQCISFATHLFSHPSVQVRPARTLIRGRCRGHTWQDDRYFRPLAGFAIEIEPATQTIRDDVVDDVQTEARAALVASRREEWIERLTLDIEIHAAAIVGKNDLDIVLPGCPHPNVDNTSRTVGKSVCDRVEE